MEFGSLPRLLVRRPGFNPRVPGLEIDLPRPGAAGYDPIPTVTVLRQRNAGISVSTAVTDVWKALLEHLAMVPGTFWGVVAGSLFSLGGVMLTSRDNRKRLEKQFDHERQVRTAEREHALRRDVYLASAEAFSAVLATIGSFGNLATPFEDLTRAIVDRLAVTAKIQLTGSEKSIYSLTKFNGELTGVVQKLLVRRVPLTSIRQQIDLLDAQIAQFGSERDRWLEAMKAFNLEGSPDARRWDVIAGNFQFEKNRVDETLTNRNNIAEGLSEQQIIYSRACIHETQRLGLLLIPLLEAARQDLGLPFDGAAYTRTLSEAHGKMLADFDAMLDDLRRAAQS